MPAKWNKEKKNSNSFYTLFRLLTVLRTNALHRINSFSLSLLFFCVFFCVACFHSILEIISSLQRVGWLARVKVHRIQPRGRGVGQGNTTPPPLSPHQHAHPNTLCVPHHCNIANKKKMTTMTMIKMVMMEKEQGKEELWYCDVSICTNADTCCWHTYCYVTHTAHTHTHLGGTHKNLKGDKSSSGLNITGHTMIMRWHDTTQYSQAISLCAKVEQHFTCTSAHLYIPSTTSIR